MVSTLTKPKYVYLNLFILFTYPFEITVLDKEPKKEGIKKLSQIVGSVFQSLKSEFFNLNTTDEILFECCNHLIPCEEMLKRKEKISKQLKEAIYQNFNSFII